MIEETMNQRGPVLMQTRGRWLARDRWRAPFRNLPFRVPQDVNAIRIVIDYTQSDDAALDVGLRHEGRWVGWSGSELTEIEVGAAGSDPGYHPGLRPGEYMLVLGLHRIPERGLPFEVRVVGATEPAGSRPNSKEHEEPTTPIGVGQGYAGEGRTWRRGDLHVHSTHSDGVHTPLELAQHAREIGLDFLAITDHNTTSAAEELIEAERLTGVALLIGQELTTDVGYATVLGRSEPVDFRRQPDDWVSLLDNASTIFINHPVRENGGWRARTTIRLPALELWNGAEPLTVDAPVIDWWRRYGLQTVPLGGSGWHRAGANAVLGRPTTWLPVLGTDYVEAVKRGRVAITATPDGPSILRHDGEIVIQGAVGCRVHSLVTGFDVLRRIESSTTSIAPCPGPLLLIDQADDVVALCS